MFLKKLSIILATILISSFYLTTLALAQNQPYAQLLWYYKITQPQNCTPEQLTCDNQGGITPTSTSGDPSQKCPGDQTSTCLDFSFQPVLGDVDHDGLPEVIFIRCNDVYVLKDTDNDGLADVIWQHEVWPIRDNIAPPPRVAEVADMNNDGLLEIISPIGNDLNSTGFTIFQPWDAQGKKRENPILWQYTYPNYPTEIMNPKFAIGDVNNDHYPDVIATAKVGSTGKVFAVGGKEKNIIWQYSTPNQISLFSSPSLFDMDRDGFLDVIIAYSSSVEVLKVYPNNPPISIMKWSIPSEAGQNFINANAIADINNDTFPEILQAAQTPQSTVGPDSIYALTTKDGVLKPLWTYTVNDSILSSGYLAMGDIDHDGKSMELVFATAWWAINILNANGELSWTSEIRGNIPVLANLDADLDPNEDLEIPITLWGIGFLHRAPPPSSDAVNAIFDPSTVSTDPIYTYPLPKGTETPGSSSPVIGDLDGDGKLEVVFLNWDAVDTPPLLASQKCNVGTLRAIKTNFSHVNRGQVVWGTYKANNYKTSTLGELIPPPIFQRGDANNDGKVDLADAIFLLNHLFLGGGNPSCLDAADFDNTGAIDITDAKFLLNHLFLGGPALPDPYQKCGVDTDVHLGCQSYDVTTCPAQ